jgi:hypothetical protein
MEQLRWVSRVPATLKDAQDLLINLHLNALRVGYLGTKLTSNRRLLVVLC